MNINKNLPSESEDAESLFQFVDEEHRSRWSRSYINTTLFSLHDDLLWNIMICLIIFVGLFCFTETDSGFYLFHLVYDIAYAVHVLLLAYSLVANEDDNHFGVCALCCFFLDAASYLFYIFDEPYKVPTQIICYILRFHRSLRYLWSLNEKNIQSSVWLTTLKYAYFIYVVRLFWIFIWYTIGLISSYKEFIASNKTSTDIFLITAYVVNKMLIPIGPSVAPKNDLERIVCLLVMLTGCVLITGAAVASLSLVISIHMRPEETFRTRYKLITKEMEIYNIPPTLRDKVQTFYKMYWHKQRAVSTNDLLTIFPPSLTATIDADIYFKATQKCRILRDLSDQFLSELAKKMETIHYIPGDAIIKRNRNKSSIIYITYGDIEMLTAEDDSTPILRMIRGTILSPCGGCPEAGCCKAYVEIRAATFCTAQILNISELWKTVLKYGKENGQRAIILKSFRKHLAKAKLHYFSRFDQGEVTYKSSILHFKRNLMTLKESKDDDGNLLLAQTDYMIEIAGCYLIRNRSDASLSDEADAICLRPTFPCILQPRSSLQVAWNTFISCLILTVCITHPYYLIYKYQVPLEFRLFDYMVTVIYMLDLLVYLATGANVEEGVPITFAQTTSQQARSKWFVLDVIGTLPLFEFISDGHFAGLNKLLRLPKVFRALKTVEDECVYHSNIIRFMTYSLLILLACYLLAVLEQGYMCYGSGYCVVSNFTHSPYWEHRPLEMEDMGDTITFGLYWAISMITFTSHLETFGVKSMTSIIYTGIILDICIILYIFMEAVYSATIMVTTALREDFDACIENVKNFLVRNNMDPVLRQRFIQYLQLRWYTDKAYSITNKQHSIFYDLPAHVYQDIVTRQRRKYILSIPFMKYLHKEDLKTISSNAKLFCSSPNEILLNTGDIINEMYVIKRGLCEILSPETKNVVGELHSKGHFGVIECLLRLPAFYTVRTVTHVEVFSISRKYLVNATDIPQIQDAIEFCKEQSLYSVLQNPRDPFLSYQPPAPTPNKEKFRLPRKYEQDKAFLQPFYSFGMLSGLRYMFPRYTLRPDGLYVARMERVRVACAVLSASIYPSYTYMVVQMPCLYLVTLLLDISAYFDVVQRMLIGYYNERGILIYHPATTAAHYLKGAFVIDLFGCLPLERLESSWMESLHGKYKESPIKQFLMLNRLIQLYRMPSAFVELTSLIRRDLLLVIKATPIFLTLLNVLTCFIVYYSVDVFYSTEDGSWAIVPLEDEGGSWLNLFQSTLRFNLTESPWNLHLASYFWVVYETTTTGYSSFKPTNVYIMRVLIAGMLIGAMITTYYSVRIISMRARVNKNLGSYQEHLKDIAVFMKRENIDSQLKRQILEYYKYNWDKTAGMDYRNVLKLCDQITLRTDALLYIYGDTFNMCPIFYERDISLLRIIGRALRSFYFLKDTTVVNKDDVICDIYFVDHGSVVVLNPDTKENITLTKGSMFGNLQSSSSIRCPVSITTSSQVHLLEISSQVFFSIVSEFPVVANLLTSYRPNNENYIRATTSETNSNDSFETYVRGESVINYFKIKQTSIRIYLITICYICILIEVYNAGFQHNGPLLIAWLYFLDFCFIWKILIFYFLLSIVKSNDSDVQYLATIRKEYFQNEFKYDLLSFFPFEVFCVLVEKRTLAFSWLRLNRLLRIVTIYKCLKSHHERITVNLPLTTTCSVIIWFTISIHTCACLWYYIAVVEEQKEPNSSWIYMNNGQQWCGNRYICSLYFIMTTFTQNGVGDILPKKQSEVIFVSILQLISTMMYMVYVGELSNIIQYQSFRNFNYYTSYLQLQEYLKNNRVSDVLVKWVNKYSLHLWRETRGLQVPHFLKIAPNCLKLKVMSAAYLQHFTNNPVFRSCEPAFLRQLVVYLQLHIYDSDMFIVKENEITDCMYIIHVGRVQESYEPSYITRTYHVGDFFGEAQGLVQNLPFTNSYKTVAKSQVLTLNLKEWEDLLNHFPRSRKSIYRNMQDDKSSNNSDGDDGAFGKIEGRNNNNFSRKPFTSTGLKRASDAKLTNESRQLRDIPGPSGVYKSKSKNELNVSPPITGNSPVASSSHLKDGFANTTPEKENDKTSLENSFSLEDSDDSYYTTNKQTHDFVSVEDYIQRQRGVQNLNETNTSTEPSKKRKHRVRYNENEIARVASEHESHELKPIRNTSNEEKNLNSLDSDMQEVEKGDRDSSSESSTSNGSGFDKHFTNA